jgi:transcriptional regulator
MRKNSFAQLISNNNGKLTATHVPVLLDKDEGGEHYLFGHISSANLQYKDVSPDVLVIFQGPHQYISSSWYETDQSVPTWNYVAVHAYGTIEFTREKDILTDILKRTVNYFESPGTKYSMDNLGEEYFDKLLKGIVGFKITITNLEGKWKLSQNHPDERKQRVINELEKQDDENSSAVAGLMKLHLGKKQ